MSSKSIPASTVTLNAYTVVAVPRLTTWTTVSIVTTETNWFHVRSYLLYDHCPAHSHGTDLFDDNSTTHSHSHGTNLFNNNWTTHSHRTYLLNDYSSAHASSHTDGHTVHSDKRLLLNYYWALLLDNNLRLLLIHHLRLLLILHLLLWV